MGAPERVLFCFVFMYVEMNTMCPKWTQKK